MVSAASGYDVIVVGLGGMGSAAAYHLAARGRRVLGLERHEPAHDKGSSHGGSRIIRQAYFEDPGYVPLLLRAYELWEKLAADSQRDVYRLTGGLFIGPADCLIVSGSLRASRQWDLPHELLDAAEITARFPNFTPRPEDIALYDAKAGFARPELTVRAHLEIAEKAGATMRRRGAGGGGGRCAHGSKGPKKRGAGWRLVNPCWIGTRPPRGYGSLR